MLISVYGTSTPFAYWGFSATVHLARRLCDDQIHHVHGVSLDEFMNGLTARDGRSVVFTSDIPDPAITDLLVDFGAPIIVFVDDLPEAVAFAMHSRGFSAQDSLRFSSRSFCALAHAVRNEASLVFGSEDLSCDIRDVFTRIFAHLGHQASPESLDRLMTEVVSGYKPGDRITVAEHMAQSSYPVLMPAEAYSQTSEEDRALINASCTPYYSILAGQMPEWIDWPWAIYETAKPNTAVGASMSMVGPARFLLFGPYLTIPAGRWLVKVEFEIVDNLSGNSITLDVAKGGAVLAQAQAVLPPVGVFTCEIGFQTEDIAQPIEVRMRLERGAIEGRIGLRSIALKALEPVSSAPSLIDEHSSRDMALGP